MKVKWLLGGLAVWLAWACLASPVRGEFTLGSEFQAGDTIQTLTASIDVGGDADAVREPLALDLGLDSRCGSIPSGGRRERVCRGEQFLKRARRAMRGSRLRQRGRARSAAS